MASPMTPLAHSEILPCVAVIAAAPFGARHPVAIPTSPTVRTVQGILFCCVLIAGCLVSAGACG
jgi:hypothetical protein